jgi:hypothetical protein
MAKAVQKTGSSTRRIFVVDGGKGGAGKTMCAMMIADREVVRGNADRLLVLDADTANGDLSKRFSNAPCMTTDTDLRTADGWVGAVNKIDQYSDRADKIVVSLPANSILDSGCRSLRSVRDELNYEVVTFFAVGPTPESIILLTESYETGTISIASKVFIVVNELFGPYNLSFEGWFESDIKKRIDADPRCQVVVLPKMNYTVALLLNKAAVFTPSQILTGKLFQGTRSSLRFFLEDFWKPIDDFENQGPTIIPPYVKHTEETVDA